MYDNILFYWFKMIYMNSSTIWILHHTWVPGSWILAKGFWFVAGFTAFLTTTAALMVLQTSAMGFTACLLQDIVLGLGVSTFRVDGLDWRQSNWWASRQAGWEQSHYWEVLRWEIFMEHELRFGLGLSCLHSFKIFWPMKLSFTSNEIIQFVAHFDVSKIYKS